MRIRNSLLLQTDHSRGETGEHERGSKRGKFQGFKKRGKGFVRWVKSGDLLNVEVQGCKTKGGWKDGGEGRREIEREVIYREIISAWLRREFVTSNNECEEVGRIMHISADHISSCSRIYRMCPFSRFVCLFTMP